MRFRYSIKIDGLEQEIEQSFGLVRDFEEALDSGKLKVVLSKNDQPIEMYSFVQITVYEVDDLGVAVDLKEFEFLVISDEVILNSKYGYYEHNITLIEYTGKLDLYQKSAFQFSKDIFDNGNAKYEYLMPDIIEEYEFFPNVVMNDFEQGDAYNIIFQKGFVVLKPNIKQVYLGKIVIPKVEKGRYERYIYNSSSNDWYEGDIYLRVDESPIKYIISDSDTTIELPTGSYELTVGITVYSSMNEEYRDYDYYKFFVEVRDEFGETMYDVIMQLRDLVSKYGGIESKQYFNTTRIFDLNVEDAEFLKTVEAPQIYIPSATLRQTLIFVLSYVNALPRLKRGFTFDELSLEFFGKKLGSFVKENITENYGEQNTNQIGTRSYAELHNILPNDLNKATTYSPYQKGHQTVRSTGIQLTDEAFELKLPSGKPMYKPIKFEVALQYELKYIDDGIVTETGEMTLDLTDIYINQSEWQLKEITSNFPNAFYTRAFDEEVGLDMYKTENIAWREGDTSIKLSDVSGTLFRSTLIKSVLKHEVNKFVTERFFDENYRNDIDGVELKIIGLGSSDPMWYKNLLFNIEYITNENISIKQDKEDLSQINFYSEMRYNQDENTVSLARSSAKIYGDLQRTGNKANSFTKNHRSLSEMYEVGQRDVEGNTITSIQMIFMNDLIVATYTTIKHHNRISQATFIDQTYRWRDNYASELRQRNETYNDYVFLIPKDMNYDETSQKRVLSNQHTKIVDRKLSGQSGEVPYIYRLMFGNLGYFHSVEETKATVGLVRTDGTISNWNEGGLTLFHNFVSSPISSAGFKGGLVFKIGFNDNQVAGDGLIEKNGNWYNQAIRYTDKNARIKYFDFYILNKVPNDPLGQIYDIYPHYMIVKNSNLLKLNEEATNNDLLYFSTGEVVSGDNSNDSLIVNKDPLSNFSLNYAVNIMSYYYGLFIFGRKFYVDNHLVSDPDNETNRYLFIYNNGTYYDIFEDLKVKDGYRARLNIIARGNVYLEYEDGYTTLNVLGLLPSDTSWAIGDEDGNLLLASNENISQIEIVKTHFRPNVKVVGEESVPITASGILESLVNIQTNVVFPKIFNLEHSFQVEEELFERISFKGSLDSEVSINYNVIYPRNISINNGLQASQDSLIGVGFEGSLDSEIGVNYNIVYPSNITTNNILEFMEDLINAIVVESDYNLQSDISIDLSTIYPTNISIGHEMFASVEQKQYPLLFGVYTLDSEIGINHSVVYPTNIDLEHNLNNDYSLYDVIEYEKAFDLGSEIELNYNVIHPTIITLANNADSNISMRKDTGITTLLTNHISMNSQVVLPKTLNVNHSLISNFDSPSQLTIPSILDAYCDTTGTSGNARYYARVEVKNNADITVRMYVTIAGVQQSALVNAGATRTFSRSSSTSWSSVYITAYATAGGYANSMVTDDLFYVSCPMPPIGGTWHKIGLSSSPYCFDQGYELEGTSCETIGQKTTASSFGGPCYDYVCKI